MVGGDCLSVVCWGGTIGGDGRELWNGDDDCPGREGGGGGVNVFRPRSIAGLPPGGSNEFVSTPPELRRNGTTGGPGGGPDEPE